MEQKAITYVCPENQLKARLANTLEPLRRYELLSNIKDFQVVGNTIRIYLRSKLQLSENDKRYALALCCFITIEHQKLKTMAETEFFQVGMESLFGAKEDRSPWQTSDLDGLTKGKTIEQLIFETGGAESSNIHIQKAALAYLYLLGLERVKRYNSPMYKSPMYVYIYEIRQGNYDAPFPEQRESRKKSVVPKIEPKKGRSMKKSMKKSGGRKHKRQKSKKKIRI